MPRDLIPKTPSLNLRRSLAHTLLAVAFSVCVVLSLYPPTQTTLYPECPIHRIFGLECPGCGATRALAALLHGHLREALHCNSYFVLLLPVAVIFAFEVYRRAIRPGAFRWPSPPASAIYGMLAAAILFTIARNMI